MDLLKQWNDNLKLFGKQKVDFYSKGAILYTYLEIKYGTENRGVHYVNRNTYKNRKPEQS